MKNYYSIYKDEYIQCIFCGAQTNLYNLPKHLDCKRCLKFQSNLKITNEEKFNFLKYNNKLKTELKSETQ